MITQAELVEFLDEFLEIDRFPNDKGGIFIASDRPIRRIGLALEPWPQLNAWVRDRHLDAIFLHRPWQLEEIPTDVGVVFYHYAFDEHLTMGFNLRLASVLGMHQIEPFGEKSGRAIGMISPVRSQPVEAFRHRVQGTFGRWEHLVAGRFLSVDRVAVVGALTPELVGAAVAKNVQIYVTGQLREVATAAIRETGIEVIAIGHRRCEEWGLRSLAGVLRERFVNLSVLLPPLK